MSTDTDLADTPLRQRVLEDMAARNLNRHTQRSHISSCKRFAAWLKRSPDTATADDVRLFQQAAGSIDRYHVPASTTMRCRAVCGVMRPNSPDLAIGRHAAAGETRQDGVLWSRR